MMKNVRHTLKSYLCMRESLVQDNGHSLVPVPKRSVFSEIMTEVPLVNDDPAHQDFVFQQDEERIERLLHQD